MFPEILDRVLSLLADGEWHSFKELMEKFGLSEHKARLIVEFFTNYGFCSQEYGSVKLRANLVQFWKSLEEMK